MTARKLDASELKAVILEYGKTHHTFTAPELAHRIYPDVDKWRFKC